MPEWIERKDKYCVNWDTFLVLVVRSDAKTVRWGQISSHWLTQYL